MSEAIINPDQVNTCVCLVFVEDREGEGLFSSYKEFSQIMCEKILKYCALCFSLSGMTG